ncbi:MAG TPA: hypothetical protein VE422_46145 [Terriglobia bacterium]|nr:hypothetical protein [Terriglobia bacterium]
MRRWAVTVSLIVSLLINIVFVFGCGNAGMNSQEAAASAGAGEVPDCCRDGMCPYHAQEQKHHHSNDPSESCICDMFSGDTATFMVLSAMPAMISMQSLTVVALPLAGSAPALLVPDADDSVLIPSTPPPRA